MGVNGQVIVDVIPEVELIIGKQPAIPELQPTEAQNRFNLVFQNFIAVFTQLEHPLVLFLDDLQWADLASLTLMPDNVVELMASKIKNLPIDPQQILKLSSCIGNQFELETLAIVAETSS